MAIIDKIIYLVPKIGIERCEEVDKETNFFLSKKTSNSQIIMTIEASLNFKTWALNVIWVSDEL